MKKGLSILLLFLMGIGVFGLYPVFKILQFQAHENAQETIKDHLAKNKLTLFINAAHNKDIVWEDNGHEFHYKDHMYDVVRKEVKDNNVYYYCFNDKKETRLFACFEEMVQKLLDNSAGTNNVARNLLKLFLQVFIPTNKYSITLHDLNISYSAVYRYISNNLNSYLEIIAPPPETI